MDYSVEFINVLKNDKMVYDKVYWYQAKPVKCEVQGNPKKSVRRALRSQCLANILNQGQFFICSFKISKLNLFNFDSLSNIGYPELLQTLEIYFGSSCS